MTRRFVLLALTVSVSAGTVADPWAKRLPATATHSEVVERPTTGWKERHGKDLPAKGAKAPTYAEGIRQWQATREEKLRADNGWLTLAGRFPLKDGANTFGTGKDNDVVFPAALQGTGPDRLGTLLVDTKAKTVTLKPADGAKWSADGKPLTGERVLGTDTDKRDWVSLGRISLHVIERDGKYVLRLADNESAVRKDFAGCTWYDPDEVYKVEARFVAHPDAKPLTIMNVLGEVSKQPSPGHLEFKLKDKVYKLDAVAEGEGLFLIFRDGTAGDTTYTSGRFLTVAKRPADGDTVTLDFNQAYNPPCAFSEFTTCPLPPKQNVLDVRIEAGEKYRKPR